MNQNTKMYLGLLAVGAVAYYLLMKSKKDAPVASSSTPVEVDPQPPVRVQPPYEEPVEVVQQGPVNNMDGNFNAMQPIFKDYAGDPAGFFSTEKVKLNY
jgi:hypothetical protein